MELRGRGMLASGIVSIHLESLLATSLTALTHNYMLYLYTTHIGWSGHTVKILSQAGKCAPHEYIHAVFASET